MRGAMLGMLFLMSTGCAVTTRTTSDPLDTLVQNLEDPRECNAKGGKIVAYMQFVSGCEWPTRDGGKSCTDNSHCDGSCLVPTTGGTVPILQMNSKTGVCSSSRTDWKTPNYTPYLSKGKAIIPACVD